MNFFDAAQFSNYNHCDHWVSRLSIGLEIKSDMQL